MDLNLTDNEFVWMVRLMKYHRNVIKRAIVSKKLSPRSHKLAIKDVEKTDDMLAKMLGKAKA